MVNCTDLLRDRQDDSFCAVAPGQTQTSAEKQTRKQGAIVGYALFAETYPHRQCEWLLACVLFTVGLIYGLAAADFAVPLYDASNLMVPRWLWGLIGVSIGALRLVFLTVNGFYRRSPHWRAMGSGLACLAWLQLSIAALQSPVAGATIAIWPVFLWFDFKAALTAAGEARVADDRANGGANDTRDT